MSLVWSGSDILFDTHARWCTVKLVLWMRPILLCVPLWDQTQIFIAAFGQGHRLDVEPWNTCEEFHANTRRTCILPPRNWVGGDLLGGHIADMTPLWCAASVSGMWYLIMIYKSENAKRPRSKKKEKAHVKASMAWLCLTHNNYVYICIFILVLFILASS